MSIREIAGLATIETPDGVTEEIPNFAFKSEILRYASSMLFSSWQTTNYPATIIYPWKSAFGYDLTNLNIKHGFPYDNTGEARWPGGNYADMNAKHFHKYRFSSSIAAWSTAVNARAFAGIGAADHRTLNIYGWQGNLLSLAEFPKALTQKGLMYEHPVYTSTAATTLGASYIVPAANHIYTWKSHVYGWLRITSGADQGLFQVAHFDHTNNRVYLKHLDGNMFSATATSASVTTEYAFRRAFFNETLIIKQSTGKPVFTGKYTPLTARQPGMFRLKYEKTGSDEAETDQRGSYYFSFQPWYFGEGAPGDYYRSDEGLPHQCRLLNFGDTNNAFKSSAVNCNIATVGGGGHATEYAFDETAQRLWFIGASTTANSYLSGIYWWYYKSAESFHEVACNHASGAGLSGAGDVATPIAMTGAEACTLMQGSDRKIYVILKQFSGGGTTNCGLVIIHPTGYPVVSPMTVQQYKTADWANYATVNGAAIDRSRYRSFSNIDTTAGGPPGVIEDIAGTTFTQSDLGRAFKVNSGADAGTYLISNVVDNNTIQVTTMAGGAVSFTGSTGVTGQIGDRIYLMFADATTNSGKLNYVESLDPSTVLFKTVTMTNGQQMISRAYVGLSTAADVDQDTGNLYWCSTGATPQANRYNPTTNTVIELGLAALSTVTAGSPSPANPATHTAFYTVKVNPKFDEVWLGTSNTGAVKMKKSSWAAADVARYYGINNAPTAYANPAGVPRSTGIPSSFTYGTNNNHTIQPVICPDGAVFYLSSVGGGSWEAGAVGYSREVDNFFMLDRGSCITEVSYFPTWFFDPYGGGVAISLGGDAGWLGQTLGREMDYQYIGGVWTPKEVVRGVLPGSTPADSITAGCLAKPIHSAAEDLIYGIKVAFTKQGGATPANNEFLGRLGQVGAVRTDGSTTVVASAPTQLFTGTGFTAGDVGRYLRIHSGVNQGIYIVTAFTSSVLVTVKRASGVSFAWAGGSPETGQTYSIWSAGSPQVNAGPECVTMPVADGLLKDTSQTFSGLGYEFHMFKTKLSEYDEGIKFCIDPPGAPPGGSALAAPVWEAKYMNYPNGGAQYDAALFGHKKMENTATLPTPTKVTDVINGTKDLFMSGQDGNSNAVKAYLHSNFTSPDPYWRGIKSNLYGRGYALTVDLKKDVEVGYVVVRMSQNDTNPPQILNPGAGGNYSGIYSASNGVDVSTDTAVGDARYTGGTGLSYTALAANLTVSGNFAGSVVLTGTDGSTVSGENKIYSVANPFLASHEGHTIQISTGANPSDQGYYRIIEVDAGGNWVRIKNLNLTDRAWVGTVGSITWTMTDGVREEDMIVSPSIGTPTYRFLVLRLIDIQTAQIQMLGGTSLVSQSYDVIKPKWREVKRLTNGIASTAPDEANNKTWGCGDGLDHYSEGDGKIFFDFTDLPVAKRTGRYWKWAIQPRYEALGYNNVGHHYMVSMEFYAPSGNRIGFCSYNRLDSVTAEADYMSSHLSRLDFIQASSSAVGTGFNGNVDVTAAGVVTPTTGGNKFLGFQTRPVQTNGGPVATTANFGGTGFVDSDKGRFLRIQTGPNAGYYRVTGVTSAILLTVSTPAGSPVTFAVDGGGQTYTLHEGIQVGTTGMDYINFGALDSGDEWPIRGINDALTSITIDDRGTGQSLTGVAFEIRKRAINDYNSSATLPAPTASKTARILYAYRIQGSLPQQPGDVFADSNGYLRYWANDIGNQVVHTDGTTVISTGTFQTIANTFSKDDEGRVLQITSGADIGNYKISVFVSATEVTVVNLYTGAAYNFTAGAGSLSFKILGERRFRLARYATVVRA